MTAADAISAIVWSLDALRKCGLQPASEVIIQSVPEEESTGNGTLMTHIKGYRADAMLCPEPVQEQLVRANVGVLWFQVEVRGRPTHVRVMGTGVNAIDACWRLVAPLRELEAEWNERHAKAQHFEDEKHPLSKSFHVADFLAETPSHPSSHPTQSWHVAGCYPLHALYPDHSLLYAPSVSHTA
jgi:acetylornithine deacetylase/succinyl-diaminopimelate desuccinylase-like protein